MATLICCVFWSCSKSSFKHTFSYSWKSLSIRNAQSGIHFLFLLCSTGSVMSSRGQHRQVRVEKWLTQSPLLSLPGPKCFEERRSLGTTTSKWSRYHIETYDAAESYIKGWVGSEQRWKWDETDTIFMFDMEMHRFPLTSWGMVSWHIFNKSKRRIQISSACLWLYTTGCKFLETKVQRK